MATTYLNLVNSTLRQLGEVPLTALANARGIQSTAMDAINNTYFDICQEENEWPFLHDTDTQTCVVGQRDYTIKTGGGDIDWETFVLLPEASSPTINKALTLPLLSLTEYYRSLWFENDTENDSDLYTIPKRVVRAQAADTIYLTPRPDQLYQFFYELWDIPTELSNDTDEPLIPERYRHIIKYGALFHIFSHRDDPAFADRWEKRYRKGVENMREALINRNDYFTSRMAAWRDNFGHVKVG
jgi:hypothetical protein